MLGVRGVSATVVAAVAVAAPLAAGCGGAPADVSGDYTITVTNGDNGCMFPNWTVGQETKNIDVKITQQGSDAAAMVSGAVGAYFDLVFGTSNFVGTVDGAHLSLTLTGTRSASQGSCAYTVNGNLSADLSGDALTGNIIYVPDTNKSPDCATLASCQSQQDFNGTRPPQ